MPDCNAVRTVPFRQFGNLWTFVHSLHFNQDPFIERFYGDSYPTSDSDDEALCPALVSFSNFVRNVLILHRRPTINKFHLQIYQGTHEIELWIRFALSREAKALKVNIRSSCYDFCCLPHAAVTNQSLVSLEIMLCKMEHQSRVHMGSLRKLVLDFVYLSDEMLEKIISGCPSLEELVIVSPYHSENKCVMSPSIKRLQLVGWAIRTLNCPNLKILDIRTNVADMGEIDVSSVSEAKIKLEGAPSSRSASVCLPFMGKISNAQVVELSDDTIQMETSCLEVMDSSNSYIGSLCFGQKFTLLGRTYIAIQEDETCPILIWDTVFDPDRLFQELSSPCGMPQLKTITIHGFRKPHQAQLELVEFLLKSAANLEQLLFVSNQQNQLATAEELEFFRQLTIHERASTNARVVFA
ncbi:hypothetical protein Cgig2_011614 [Carnegiea gigantea]|uniref:FBD domain-containing protein n=1 Tax=Carnegiea gigantea TaxID=171969 RepID=A0A9Q1GVA6_9CARY|nr:hypothetical protein Cgig2_011614 [Carnegiea gigantea]